MYIKRNNQGEIIALDSTANLLNRVPGKNLRLKLGGAMLPQALEPLVRSMDNDIYTLSLNEIAQIEQVLAELRNANVMVEDLQVIETDLEDVFVELVGRK